mgnify:FL=1
MEKMNPDIPLQNACLEYFKRQKRMRQNDKVRISFSGLFPENRKEEKK